MSQAPEASSSNALTLAILVGLTTVTALAAIGLGSTTIAPKRVLEILLGTSAPDQETARDSLVIMQIRIPRVLLGLAVGAALAVAGAIMQGLFRNPLADPGLIGVSSGAGFASAATIVLGGRLFPGSAASLPFVVLPLAAFLGALVSTLLLYALASRDGRTSMTVMLLAGIAFAALAGAGTGWLSYISDDRQLRDLTFWSMGSLGGATWRKAAILIPMIVPALIAVPFLARGLNAMALGEAEAFHLGIDVQRLKTVAVLLVSVAVGAAVACSGLIGFVGIIVPHLLRLFVGANYRLLLPASALFGADIFARTIIAPSELPIGIVTATLGAPFFLWLLLRRRPDLCT